MKGIIYCAENDINSKVYIGQTIKTLKQRRYNHINSNNVSHFHRALKKYDNWTWTILQEYEAHDKLTMRSILNKAEIYYIEAFDSFRNGYNMTKGGEGNLGWVLSEENIKNMIKGQEGKIVPKEVGRKISKALKGRTMSEENKLKDKIANLNTIQPYAKKVKCKETKIIYNSIRQAAIKTNIDRSCISRCLLGRFKKAGGYSWTYI